MGYTIIEMTDILLAALKAELEAQGDAEVCSLTKQPGDSVALDFADCGVMAWVRLVGAVPSVGGTGYDITPNSCFWGLAHEVEVGVMRPSPMPDETLNSLELPSDAEMTEATDRQLQDMKAIHRAILAARREFELIPTGYTPVGPLGGTVGGTWALTIAEE